MKSLLVALSVFVSSYAFSAAYKSHDEVYNQMYDTIVADSVLYHSEIEVCLYGDCRTYPALSKILRTEKPDDEKTKDTGTGGSVDYPVEKTETPPPSVDDWQIAQAIASVIEAISSKGDLGGSLSVTHENTTTTKPDGTVIRGSKTSVTISAGSGGAAKPATGSGVKPGGGSKEHHSQLH